MNIFKGYRYFKSEFLKLKRCYVFLIAFAFTAVEIVWIFISKDTDEAIKKGWMMLLYQLPLINTIFIPFLASVIASRLCDIEHKGGMLKQLCTLESRGRLYDVKLFAGLGIMTSCLLLQFGMLYIVGRYIGFEGRFPLALYMLYGLFTLMPTVTIYMFQHSLSLLFKNQAISFLAGIIGQFCGVFSLFLSQAPWFRKGLIWGHYGVLQIVGADWNRETRISNFFLLEIEWNFIPVLLLITIVLYAAGKKLFCESEV